MIHLVSGYSADDVWSQAANMLLGSPAVTGQDSRVGQTRELLHTCLSIENPRERWVASREPALNVAFALAEVVWIVNGRNDSQFLNYFNSQLPKHAGGGPVYHGAYGWRLRRHLAVDQLDRAYHALSKNKGSRQVVLQIWDSELDLPGEDGMPVSEDIPCNLVSMLKVRDGKLEWAQVMRSNDIFIGLPHNIVQFTFLQEVMAGWLGLDLGSYVQMSDSLHVYEKDVATIRNRKTDSFTPNEDSIAVDKGLSECCWVELGRRVEVLIDTRMTEGEYQKLVEWHEAPVGFRNILLVLCAEAARRRKWADEANAVMYQCTNGAYKQLWKRWLERIKKTTAGPDDIRCA